MKKIVVPVILLILVFSVTAFAEETRQNVDYTVVVENELFQNNGLGLNEFFAVNHLYRDIFYKFDLMKHTTRSDKLYILHRILYSLSSQKPVRVYFHNFEDGKDLILYFSLIENKGHRAIVMNTNFNVVKRKLTFKEEELDDCVQRFYHIKGDKLIADNYLYSAQRLEEIKSQKSANNLADFYLFDSREENDSLVKGILTEKINSTQNTYQRNICKITLSEYYLANGNYEKARELLDQVQDTVDDTILIRVQTLDQPVDIASEVYEITRQFEILGDYIFGDLI